jgi:hypothetical protein
MYSFKPAVSFFFTSIALHTALGLSLGNSWMHAPSKSMESIQIDYLQYEKMPATTAVSEKTVVKEPLSAKKSRGSPVAAMISRARTQDKLAPSDFQKFIEEKIKKQQRELARLSAEQSQPAMTRPKTSAEIMADPEKGKIFVGYFSEVKKKIQRTLLERYAHRYSGRGSVTLAFVLTARGQVEKVIVASKDERADEVLQDLAVQCLRLSAPFGNFPLDLGPQKIIFNVTIFFDGR